MNLAIPYHLENFIGGNFIGPLSGEFLDNVNPATGDVVGQIPNSNKKDIDIAVKAAQKALPEWSTTSNEKKFAVLNTIADLIDRHAEALALAETNDNGKPLWLSQQMDIKRASDNFRFFATAIMHFAGESHAMEDKAINYTLRQPIGIVGCISPWNLPLYLFPLEDSAGIGRRQLCNCQTQRSNTGYCFFIRQNLQRSRPARWCFKYYTRRWT